MPGWTRVWNSPSTSPPHTFTAPISVMPSAAGRPAGGLEVDDVNVVVRSGSSSSSKLACANAVDAAMSRTRRSGVRRNRGGAPGAARTLATMSRRDGRSSATTATVVARRAGAPAAASQIAVRRARPAARRGDARRRCARSPGSPRPSGTGSARRAGGGPRRRRRTSASSVADVVAEPPRSWSRRCATGRPRAASDPIDTAVVAYLDPSGRLGRPSSAATRRGGPTQRRRRPRRSDEIDAVARRARRAARPAARPRPRASATRPLPRRAEPAEEVDQAAQARCAPAPASCAPPSASATRRRARAARRSRRRPRGRRRARGGAAPAAGRLAELERARRGRPPRHPHRARRRRRPAAAAARHARRRGGRHPPRTACRAGTLRPADAVAVGRTAGARTAARQRPGRARPAARPAAGPPDRRRLQRHEDRLRRPAARRPAHPAGRRRWPRCRRASGAEVTVAFDGGAKPPAQPRAPRGRPRAVQRGRRDRRRPDPPAGRGRAAGTAGRRRDLRPRRSSTDVRRAGAWTVPSAVLLARARLTRLADAPKLSEGVPSVRETGDRRRTEAEDDDAHRLRHLRGARRALPRLRRQRAPRPCRAHTATRVELDADEQDALGSLVAAGLVPPLRLVRCRRRRSDRGIA